MPVTDSGLFVAPPFLLGYGIYAFDPVVAGAGGLAWLISLANYLPVVQYLGAPSGFVLTLPIAAILYAFMTTASAWRRLIGRSPGWRDAFERDFTDE